nr:immunoglobulin heavy chain junction region [Mus musculus]MBK4183886.1 immunoglobulin heavy chain junction region [Mus musculus]
CARGGDVDFW